MFHNAEFSIQTLPFGQFSQIVVSHLSGSQFTIVPGFGAVLNSLVLVKACTPYPVIDGHATDTMLIENKWFRSARLTPFPNRINNGCYSFMGNTYQLPINFPQQQHAIHGLVYNQPFTLAGTQLFPHSASVLLQLHYSGDITGYPFPFRLQIEFVLTGHNQFTCTTTFTNTGSHPLPFADGWHPYFTLGTPTINQLQLRLPTHKELLTNERQIPTGTLVNNHNYEQLTTIGNTQLDTGFLLLPNTENTASCTLFLPEKNLTLTIWQQVTQNTYAYLQVFTPPNRKSIAIEPMTAAPNCFNNGMGLQILKPGHVFTGTCGVALE